MDSLQVALLALILCLSVQYSYGIRCHQCDSKDDGPGACSDPYTGTNEDANECEAEHNNCFKVMAISTSVGYSKQAEEVSRVITRGCGKSHWTDSCWSETAAGGYTTVCHCDRDNCNGATSVTYAISSIIALATAAFILVRL